MARNRRDDDEEEYSDDYEIQPRRQRPRSDDYEDYDEPPRRRRRRKQLGWLDQQFTNTPIFLLILFPLCCGLVAIAFGLAGTIGCQDPKARQRAIIVLIISIVWFGIAFMIGFIQGFMEATRR